MIEFCMPSLGADMDAGTLVAWKVALGDHVARGDVMALVETQKATVEVESFQAGVVVELLVAPGEKVPVGTVLARLRASDPAAAAAQAQPPPSAVSSSVPSGPPATTTTPPAPAVPAVEPAARTRMSPAARRRARELGVEPTALRGSGPQGAVVLADVEASARATTPPAAPSAPTAATPPARPAPAATPPATDRQANVRAAVAAAMSRSKREIPHYYLATPIAMKTALGWLERKNAERAVGERLLPAVLLIKAVARALHAVPELNGLFVDGAFRPGAGVHVGMAIALRGGGVIAPALHDADQRSLDDLMEGLRDLVARARAGTLRGSELSDGTITITSLGDRGSEVVYGVIQPPQVAMVGFGTIAPRPWVVEGGVIALPVVTATLSADHRVSDGHRGGLFLTELDRRLQHPEDL